MNYYEHHIGDYAADTAHLSLVEDAIYSRLLRRYYLKEACLPADVAAVARLVGAVNELDAVETVLREFFTLTADGWRNKRCDEEIDRYMDKRRKAKIGAAASVEARRSTTVERTLNERSTDVQPTSHQSPVTRHQEEKEEPPIGGLATVPAAVPECPHGEIVELYHRKLPALRRVSAWPPERQAFLRKRWREAPERQSVAWWAAFFDYIAKSDFLMGRTVGSNGRAFDCDLEWIVRPRNFHKIIEGKYANA